MNAKKQALHKAKGGKESMSTTEKGEHSYWARKEKQGGKGYNRQIMGNKQVEAHNKKYGTKY